MSVQGPSNGGAGNGDGNGGDDRKRKRIILPKSLAIASIKVKKMRTVEENAVVEGPGPSQSQGQPQGQEVAAGGVAEPVEQQHQEVVEDVNVNVNRSMQVVPVVAVGKATRKKKGKAAVAGAGAAGTSAVVGAPAVKVVQMVKESHPLENSLVVSLVMAQLDVKSVKTARLVNKMWCEEGGKLLKKKTKVNFTSPATSLRLVDKFLKNTSRLSGEEMSMYSDFTMGRAEIHPFFYERCGKHIKKLTYTINSNRNIPQGPTLMNGNDIHRILHQYCPKLETLKLIRFPLSRYPAYEDGKNVCHLKVLTLDTTISEEFVQGIFLEAVNLQRIEVHIMDRTKIEIFFKAFDFAKTNGRLNNLKELLFIDSTLTLNDLSFLLGYGKDLKLEILTIESIFFETKLVEGITILTRLLRSLSSTLERFQLNTCSWTPTLQLNNNFSSHILIDMPYLPKLKIIKSIGNRVNFNPSSILINLPALEEWGFLTKEFSWKPQEWVVQENMKSLKLPHQLQDTDLLQRLIFSFTEIKKIQLSEPTDEVLSMFFRLMGDSKLTELDLVFDNSLHYDAVMAGWDSNFYDIPSLITTQTNLMEEPVDPENGIHRLKNLQRLDMSYIKRSQFNRIPARKYLSTHARQILNHASFTNGFARLKKGKALTLRNFVIPDEYLTVIEKHNIFEDCEFINCVIERKAEENSGVKFSFKKCSTAGPSY